MGGSSERSKRRHRDGRGLCCKVGQEIRRTWVFFAWFMGGALAIWLLGIVIALPLLIFLYILIEGRERSMTALTMTACTYLLLWGLFEYMLESRWPAGLLFQ